MAPRLTKVDQLILDQHGSLTADDECYYLLEWTKGGGYSASATNQLIANLKKTNDKKGMPGYHYKEDAIERAGYHLRNAIDPEWLKQATLVPIPPSACKTDPYYDDRMTKVLRVLTQELDKPDIRELITHTQSMTPAHLSGECRPTVNEIRSNYQIDECEAEPPPRIVGLFDDILTAGSHFRAAKLLLADRFPGLPVLGVFIARRIFPASGTEE